MRDGDEHHADETPRPPEPAPGARGIVSTIAGAGLCVALLAGAAWWLADAGDHTAQELPVFRAERTPAKVRPEDPGGAETPYREIRSYEVAAGGGASEREVRLAPPAAAPGEEDMAMGELAPLPEAAVKRI